MRPMMRTPLPPRPAGRLRPVRAARRRGRRPSRLQLLRRRARVLRGVLRLRAGGHRAARPSPRCASCAPSRPPAARAAWLAFAAGVAAASRRRRVLRRRRSMRPGRPALPELGRRGLARRLSAPPTRADAAHPPRAAARARQRVAGRADRRAGRRRGRRRRCWSRRSPPRRRAASRPWSRTSPIRWPTCCCSCASSGSCALSGWRPGRGWVVLGLAFVVLALTDTVYLYRLATGTYEVGTLLDSGWLVAFALARGRRVAAARLLRDGRPALEGTRVLVVPRSPSSSSPSASSWRPRRCDVPRARHRARGGRDRRLGRAAVAELPRGARAGRGAAGGDHGRPHRPAQPPPALPPPPRGDRRGRRGAPLRRPAADRPRPLQGAQRHARPSRRRPAPPPGRPAAARACVRDGDDRPPRRRRVRRRARRHRRRRGRSPRRLRRRAARAVRHPRRPPAHRRQHRHRPLPRARDDARGADAARGHRDVPGEGRPAAATRPTWRPPTTSPASGSS